jgi:SAM-dependent methyltransferase
VPVSILERLHARSVFPRRVKRIASIIAPMIPPRAAVLDVGCGDGQVAAQILARRPDVSITGLDILERPATAIPVRLFDGLSMPVADKSHDVVLFVDVLHHTDDPRVLLREARRVAREAVIIKDHFRDGLLAGATLRFMDWVGNARHGVRLPFNYWRRDEWVEAWEQTSLDPTLITARIDLYPAPASWLFDRSLHFVAKLRPPADRYD